MARIDLCHLCHGTNEVITRGALSLRMTLSRVGRRRGILRPFSVGPSAKPDVPVFQASGFPVLGYRS